MECISCTYTNTGTKVRKGCRVLISVNYSKQTSGESQCKVDNKSQVGDTCNWMVGLPWISKVTKYNSCGYCMPS